MKLVLTLAFAAVLRASPMTAITVVDNNTFNDALKSIGEQCYCLQDSDEFDQILASAFLDIHDTLISFSVVPMNGGQELIGVWTPSWVASDFSTPQQSVQNTPPVSPVQTNNSNSAPDPPASNDPPTTTQQSTVQTPVTTPEPGTIVVGIGLAAIYLVARSRIPLALSSDSRR